jgi:hypothetical protein
MRTMKMIGLVLVVAVLAFGAITWVALEGQEVVVVRTHGGDGAAHATRTWVADADGTTWIEAANPERPFLHDLERAPELELERGGGLQRCQAEIVPNPGGHQHIRELLAARYGWADCWIGLIADTRRSVEVRLTCG